MSDATTSSSRTPWAPSPSTTSRGGALGELSGGQRQRALLAQVAAQDAELLLLDEPFTGVDRPTEGTVR